MDHIEHSAGQRKASNASVADLISQGKGDRRIGKALGVTRHEARSLIAAYKLERAREESAGHTGLSKYEAAIQTLVLTALEFHPFANLFPLMEGDEFDDLVADIALHDIHLPIDVYQGKVLDGRNRYRAAVAAGIEIGPQHIRHFRPELYGDPLDYVISQNLKRRHLNESQRAFVAARLANMRQGERTDLQPSANLPEVAAGQSPLSDSPLQAGEGAERSEVGVGVLSAPVVSQDQAADMLNVSARLVRAAKAVQARATPELARAVEQGKLAVSAAAQAVDLDADVQRRIAEDAAAGRVNAVRLVIKQLRRDEREKSRGARLMALPQKAYGVVLEDFEWDDKVWSRETGMDRHAANHYETAADAHTPEEIVERTRERWTCAADDCVALMWSTNQHLAIALDVLRLRGFRYVSNYCWGKEAAGTGRWNRSRHELMLIGVRGAVECPAPGTQWDSLVLAPKSAHSAKPECFLDMIEDYWPTVPKIELNRRGPPRPGWAAWGNEVEDAPSASEPIVALQ